MLVERGWDPTFVRQLSVSVRCPACQLSVTAGVTTKLSLAKLVVASTNCTGKDRVVSAKVPVDPVQLPVFTSAENTKRNDSDGNKIPPFRGVYDKTLKQLASMETVPAIVPVVALRTHWWPGGLDTICTL